MHSTRRHGSSTTHLLSHDMYNQAPLLLLCLTPRHDGSCGWEMWEDADLTITLIKLYCLLDNCPGDKLPVAGPLYPMSPCVSPRHTAPSGGPVVYARFPNTKQACKHPLIVSIPVSRFTTSGADGAKHKTVTTSVTGISVGNDVSSPPCKSHPPLTLRRPDRPTQRRLPLVGCDRQHGA